MRPPVGFGHPPGAPLGVAPQQAPPVSSTPGQPTEVIDDWKEHTDKKTGRKYYHSKVSLLLEF